MSSRNSFFTGALVSFTAAFALLMLTGAVSVKTGNYKSDMGLSGMPASAMHVVCSADGRTVYISDETRVLRSRDYGDNWTTVMTSRSSENANR